MMLEPVEDSGKKTFINAFFRGFKSSFQMLKLKRMKKGCLKNKTVYKMLQSDIKK